MDVGVGAANVEESSTGLALALLAPRIVAANVEGSSGDLAINKSSYIHVHARD